MLGHYYRFHVASVARRSSFVSQKRGRALGEICFAGAHLHSVSLRPAHRRQPSAEYAALVYVDGVIPPYWTRPGRVTIYDGGAPVVLFRPVEAFGRAVGICFACDIAIEHLGAYLAVLLTDHIFLDTAVRHNEVAAVEPGIGGCRLNEAAEMFLVAGCRRISRLDFLHRLVQ